MSSVKIQGDSSGTGVLTISAPNTNTDRSITIPDKAGAIAIGAGTVVQFVSSTGTSATSTTSSTFTDCGISASITPTSTSNKIVINIVSNVQVSRSADSAAGGMRILRDSTVIHASPDSSGPTQWYNAAFGGGVTSMSFNNNLGFLVVDSPSTTSSVTYKAQIAARGSATFTILTTGVPYITLMEIVA